MHPRTYLSAIAAAVLTLSCAGFEPAFCAPAAAASSDLTNPYYPAVDGAMAAMHRAMEAAARSGQVDRDFAAAMIPHHQGAIDMARAILLHGTDPAMRRLAEQIITEQSLEIALMNRILTGATAGVAAATPTAATSPAVAAPPTGANPGAVSAPPAPPAISHRDRVYTADQISNTVSVIDPAANRLLGVIPLGDPFPAALSPLYRGELLVHGLGFSPDHRTLAVISIGSNSVTLIDTATNRTKGVIYVGRSPHEAFFTPDGTELWVVIRGEDYVSVIDPVKMLEVNRIRTADGPGMVLFRPDGKYAFVPSSFTPELSVIEVATHSVVARVKQASPFSPNLAVSPDGSEVWFTLKDTGKVQVIRTSPPFDTLATLDVGPLCNHVALVDNAQGQLAFLTVGGNNEVQVWRRGAHPERIARIPTGDLPHGIWASPDGSRAYVSLENGDAVQVIDTLENKSLATIPVGKLPQAIVYVPNAVPTGASSTGLADLSRVGPAQHLRLVATENAAPDARGNVVVNSQGLLDHLQLIAAGLEPGREYQFTLEDAAGADRAPVPLARSKANPAGALVLQALGPLREIVAPAEASPRDRASARRLVLSSVDDHHPVLIQASTTETARTPVNDRTPAPTA
jgi:YVTN family beta-propeller protein